MSGWLISVRPIGATDALRKLTRRVDAWTVRLRVARPFVFEGLASWASIWVGLVLVQDQLYFDKNPLSYAWIVQNVTSHEWVMGCCAITAGTLKAVGMTCLLRRQRDDKWLEAAYFCRQIGWSASAVFWTLIAVSVWVSVPHTFGAALSSMMAVQATMVMLSGPAMPEGCKNGQ